MDKAAVTAVGEVSSLALGWLVFAAVVVVVVAGLIIWAVIASRKNAKGMSNLERRLQHGKKKK